MEGLDEAYIQFIYLIWRMN